MARFRFFGEDLEKRAFTLVELLTIVAIVIVLATVLFPVFANAKGAKQADSLTHIKEVSHASQLYSADYDDNFVIMAQNYIDGACGIPAASGTVVCIDNLPVAPPAWDLLLVPYLKTMGTLIDPATGDPQGYFGTGPQAIPGYQNSVAQYGYNYEFLSPVIIAGPNSAGWLSPSIAASIGFQLTTNSRSESMAVHPAQTPAFVSAEGWCTVNSGAAQFATPDFDLANPPGTYYQELLASNRLAFTGIGSSAPLWEENWMKHSPIGELTSSVRALSPYVDANVAWIDGHASNMTADELATGTDFETASTSENGGAGTMVTDVSKFLWTLDGTLDDAGNP